MVDENLLRINAKVSIPLAELQFRFSTSRGPGGQHANKVATKATLLFDVVNSPSLDDASRKLLLTKLAGRIDKEGVLKIDSQESRSQHRNRETAVSKFQQLLTDALKPQKKRRKTKPSRAAKERRLENKKKQSRRKKERRQKWEREE